MKLNISSYSEDREFHSFRAVRPIKLLQYIAIFSVLSHFPLPHTSSCRLLSPSRTGQYGDAPEKKPSGWFPVWQRLRLRSAFAIVKKGGLSVYFVLLDLVSHSRPEHTKTSRRGNSPCLAQYTSSSEMYNAKQAAKVDFAPRAASKGKRGVLSFIFQWHVTCLHLRCRQRGDIKIALLFRQQLSMVIEGQRAMLRQRGFCSC